MVEDGVYASACRLSYRCCLLRLRSRSFGRGSNDGELWQRSKLFGLLRRRGGCRGGRRRHIRVQTDGTDSQSRMIPVISSRRRVRTEVSCCGLTRTTKAAG